MTAPNRPASDRPPDDRPPDASPSPPPRPDSVPPESADRHRSDEPSIRPDETPPGVFDSAPIATPRAHDLRLPGIGPDGMPIPRRVPERDPGATIVNPQASLPGAPPRRVSVSRSAPPRPRSRLGAWGCLLRLMIAGAFGVVGLFFAGLAYAGIVYYSIARELPAVEDLQARASQFETMRIYDRDGNLLHQLVDPSAGRRTRVPLSRISPYLVAATIATEDSQFYQHPGFDPVAIVRAIWQNASQGEVVSGASTITQQLTRALLFDPQERQERSSRRKLREIILAAEIERRYAKDEILELYLNEIYYGNLAYGVEAAAETYFDTTADRLTLAQASFLAGLPQAPSVYDVYTRPEVTLQRHQDVLTLMVLAGCIPVGNAPEPVCVTPEQAGAAAAEIGGATFVPPAGEFRYPHWVNYVRSLLEDQFGPQFVYRSGYNVYTTLSPGLQDLAQQTVVEQVNALADRHVTNGALVALHPPTGQILAMVGSKDFDDASISGQVNMALAPRQPGSSIKPLTYVAAFEKGWTPSTLLWDVPSEFPPSGLPTDPREPYKPVNYDGKFHGPVRLRSALANSYNVPAVKALAFVGIHDDPATAAREGLIPFAERLGITSLNRPDYGLSLTLGGGEVSLLELTGAYAAFANGGLRVPPVAILKITTFDGQVIYEYTPPAGEPVVRPEHAYLISHILSDNDSRTPAFGPRSALRLSFRAAAKTGTTDDYRDNWTLGYTPDLAAGVWVGNADYTPMQGTSGLTGAAPIWRAVMEAGIKLIPGAPTDFVRPATIVERPVCALTGAEPGDWCPSVIAELFAADQPPTPKDADLRQRAYIDRWTGLRASAACPDDYDERLVLDIADPFGRQWVVEDPAGQAWVSALGFSPPLPWPPDGECGPDSSRPVVAIDFPHEGDVVQGSVPVWGRAAAQAAGDFDRFVLEFGLSHDPQGWGGVAGPVGAPLAETGFIADWDTSSLPNGPVTLRLVVYNPRGGRAEARVHLTIANPTPAPTPTETPCVKRNGRPCDEPDDTATPAATDVTAQPAASETPSPVPCGTPAP